MEGTKTGLAAVYEKNFIGDICCSWVVNNWNGDGITEMGVFRGSHTWYLDYNGNGVWDGTPADRIMELGNFGDIPVTGKW